MPLGRVSGDLNVGMMYAIGGIVVAGVGFVIIYYDMAKDKTSSNYNELETLTKAKKQNEQLRGWHIDHNPADSNTQEDDPENKKDPV